MKTLSTLLAATILSGTIGVMPAFAADTNSPAASASTQSEQQMDQQLQATASQVLGNITIATMALAYGMNDDATSHIDAARQAIAQINGQMNSYNSGVPAMAGKLSYKTANAEGDYWIPFINDRFAVRTLDGKHFASKNPDMDVTDAQTVHYEMFLDTKAVDAQLAQAQTAISQQQYDVAMNALQDVTKGAMSDIVVADRPLEAARDNLILSRELLQDKDYRGASFALNHANKELAQVEKDNPDSADNANIKRMQAKIDSLQASITKENPSRLKTAEAKIDGWIKDVKAWIHSES